LKLVKLVDVLLPSIIAAATEVGDALRAHLVSADGPQLVRRAVATAVVGGLGVALIATAAPGAAAMTAALPAPDDLLGNLSALALDTNEPAIGDADAAPLARPSAPDWEPPGWYPGADALLPIQGMDMDPAHPSRPSLNARSAYAYDLDSGEVLLAYNPDERWPVASLTKLVAGLAAVSEAPDLERVHCVDERWYPTRNGARSKFSTGECYRGWDMLGSMMVASDNRGAYGMQVASGLEYEAFIGRMNTVAAELGMSYSSFSDPSGLEDDNLSTARDMAKAVVAAAYHPVLSVVVNAPRWETQRMDAPGGRSLNTTNRLAARTSLEVLAAKTGYTDTARYCYTALVRTSSGRRVALSVIGANRSSQRWSDVDRLLRWIEKS